MEDTCNIRTVLNYKLFNEQCDVVMLAPNAEQSYVRLHTIYVYIVSHSFLSCHVLWLKMPVM